jgi:membrane-associated phospholipid phosphatase
LTSAGLRPVLQKGNDQPEAEGGSGGRPVIKELLDRVRPALNPITETLGPSFPSGHTTAAAAFYAAAALVLGRGFGKHGRALLAGAAAGIAVAVACTRVFLDVHWLTDTGAGLFLGWAWFAVCCIAFGGRRFLRLGAAARAGHARGGRGAT